MSPLHFFLVLLVVSVWGCNFVAIRLSLDVIPPVLLVCARFFLTSIPAIFFIKRPDVPFKKVVVYGIVMFALQFSFLFIGIGLGVPPGLASLITQVQFFFSVVLGAIFFNEKIHKWLFIGSMISFSGLIVVATHINGTITLPAFLFLLTSAFFWAIGNSLSKQMGKVNTISLVVWSSFVAWPPLLLLSYILDGPEKILFAMNHLNYKAIAGTLYITYCSTLFGYGLWSYLVSCNPLSKISAFTILIPVAAMISSVLILHESIEPWKVTAGLLIVAGLTANLHGEKIVKKVEELLRPTEKIL